jgi:hypothetical protein
MPQQTVESDRSAATDSDEQAEKEGDRDPIESKGTTLYRSPKCPGCGEIGSYEGAGSTGVSNWEGKPFVARYCGDCDRRYYVYAAGSDTPTIR